MLPLRSTLLAARTARALVTLPFAMLVHLLSVLENLPVLQCSTLRATVEHGTSRSLEGAPLADRRAGLG